VRGRLADPARGPALRDALRAFAVAAPEYIDEQVQAVARRYLGDKPEHAP
jgi:hypothetical protein